ncbi:UDP-N-acetylmuramate:L-alanyl-gamma-D-glutamyl-meso-diaminopimelate ligase [Marinobacterium sediminicola]|uniref:UDP-N-acetylmuramate--L-alanyl-gamma-D-glutamyl-meso-2,6-diaminoheptandioate ligase n=1 Tax=Marinobacterium sediminicola TaxID=518898 RepID=A0ABY1S027_9GAMM|nr:UDP-N-acetylmuramate:L-alanyl-gamma-D-glutamyl-meso-diaminopimelate ligase [Marinobacterium sediminicola]ULG69975.1 UDP-N-acetylmuramate:L-alanyl-gamma-D-glutamyl-meso-diaminopimelate ligase [Marinobacterium sediminicola]SMR74425.1 UDP-N-acetylmuramate: L-alanyl-gamma-D-glutamyl-meso-diaminopimelate ligase [Marinobacterium sediminicola]
MHIHILGICGTFMGSLAVLAKQLGHRVTGSDANVYPPMSTQLEQQGIELIEGYDPAQLEPQPDLVVVGNAMSRGNPCIEYMLERNMRFTSGPQWLHDHLLADRWVLAVAGTHGKTTTATMLAWILEQAGMAPGYLIGGIPMGFETSARLGETPFFVIEADEYDTAFFDKRSKFVHYNPRTLILNNLEFDHADIFPDLAAIQRQFHHLVRLVPGGGQIIMPADAPALNEVIDMGCWSGRVLTGFDRRATWSAQLLSEDGSHFAVQHEGETVGEVCWQQTGLHNVSNAINALVAARHVGVQPEHAIAALSRFGGVKRRMERLGEVAGITVYDDFAHHPTAIQTTLEGIKARVGEHAPVIAVIEPRSNTMRLGAHKEALAQSTAAADRVYWYQPEGMDWSLDEVVEQSTVPAQLESQLDTLLGRLVSELPRGAQVVIMSNGGFGGIHQKLLKALEQRESIHVL